MRFSTSIENKTPITVFRLKLISILSCNSPGLQPGKSAMLAYVQENLLFVERKKAHVGEAEATDFEAKCTAQIKGRLQAKPVMLTESNKISRLLADSMLSEENKDLLE